LAFIENSILGLYDYGFRDYKPQLGRWTTVDPIRSGDNCYAYCGNDPLRFIDLFGLQVEPWTSGNVPSIIVTKERIYNEYFKENFEIFDALAAS